MSHIYYRMFQVQYCTNPIANLNFFIIEILSLRTRMAIYAHIHHCDNLCDGKMRDQNQKKESL